MRLKITAVNFTTENDWIFKLTDENGGDFFIMNVVFYRKYNFKDPLEKRELDYFDKGQWINACVDLIEGKNIVVSL